MRFTDRLGLVSKGTVWSRCLLALLLFLSPALNTRCRDSGNVLVVGSKNFTEQVILGEMLAQHLEKEGEVVVRRRLNLAGTFLCHEALRSGEIDLYVEYTGTALTAILNEDPIGDPRLVYDTVQREYSRLFGLEWMKPLGFNNTFAIMVRGEDARRLGLERVSDLGPYASRWRAGFGYEFLERQDGFRGLVEAYGLAFGRAPMEMELGLMYRALRDGQVDLIAGNSTEGLVEALDLVVLRDDLNYFPPYQAAPVVRRSTLDENAWIIEALDGLGGSISDEEMRRMNYRVDGQHRPAKEVVAEFLASKGL